MIENQVHSKLSSPRLRNEMEEGPYGKMIARGRVPNTRTSAGVDVGSG